MHLDRLNYALCWEDPALLVEGLRPTGRRLISIGSGGENSLALLAAGADRVELVEINEHQLHLLEIKLAAIRQLTPTEVPALLGLAPATASQRRRLAGDLRLTPATRAWLAARSRQLDGGLALAGRFEGYFRLFRRLALPLAHSRRRVAELLQPRDPSARREFFEQRWDTPRWRALFGLFFSRPVMARLGRSEGQFAHATDDLASMLRARVEHALTELDPAINPWLHLILTGQPGPVLPPPYDPDSLERLRRALDEDRLHIHRGGLDEVLPRLGGRHDGANLSDIFEYLDQPTTAALLEDLHQSANPGACLAWWEMLVPRPVPPRLADSFRSLDAEAAALHARDRCFFYRGFRLAEAC